MKSVKLCKLEELVKSKLSVKTSSVGRKKRDCPISKVVPPKESLIITTMILSSSTVLPLISPLGAYSFKRVEGWGLIRVFF